jgi:hypothetical protein
MAGNCYRAMFHRMSKLAVTALGADETPPVSFDELDRFANLHLPPPEVSAAQRVVQ